MRLNMQMGLLLKAGKLTLCMRELKIAVIYCSSPNDANHSNI